MTAADAAANHTDAMQPLGAAEAGGEFPPTYTRPTNTPCHVHWSWYLFSVTCSAYDTVRYTLRPRYDSSETLRQSSFDNVQKVTKHKGLFN